MISKDNQSGQTAFKDHREINNNSHLCFLFTKSFSHLNSFSIYLQYDNNKKIEFKSGEKKKVFLTSKLTFSYDEQKIKRFSIKTASKR